MKLTPESSGVYAIFAAGTGILPFLDFFDFLLKKSVFEASKTINQALSKKVKEFLEDEDLNETLSGLKVKFYGTFASKDDFIGEEIIDYLYRINKLYKLEIFDCEIKFSSKKKLLKSEQSM